MSVTPLRTMQFEQTPVAVYASNEEMGLAAALDAREIIRAVLAEREEANIILATGNSQLSFLHALRDLEDIEWWRVHVFHMDEYLGIEPTHHASFPFFLRRHILNVVKPKAFYPVPGQVENVERACADYADRLRAHPADLVVLGFGENGHLAFNDPPYAEFDDPTWVKVVKLDARSRQQQVGEGHFPALNAVPTHAITLTIPALLAARRVLAIVPEARKAAAVRTCLTEPISEERPGSILRRVDHAQIYLDTDSAAQLDG